MGAQVVASYLAAHGEHVARAVFSSPGPLAPAADDGSDARLQQRLSLGEQLGLYALLARPRVLLAYTLLQVSPQAAHAFAGDAEMDAAMDRVYNRSRPALHCHGEPAGPALHGLGFYAHQFPQSAASPPWPDPRPRLARLPTPALVIKGSCDYLSWPTTLACQQALPGAALAYLHHAGHNSYQDQPGAFLAAVRAFLTSRPLPIPPWPHASAPQGHQQPAANQVQPAPQPPA